MQGDFNAKFGTDENDIWAEYVGRFELYIGLTLKPSLGLNYVYVYSNIYIYIYIYILI